MADIAIFRINYKSDFILTLNSDAGWMTPFCIKFWTGAPSRAYFVGFDGITYTHCTPVDGEPTKLRVQFDDHRLPIGDLKFQIGYHFTVADFPTSVEDEVLNQASVIIEVDDVPAQVMLDLNGETAPEIAFSLPAYANEAQRIANEQQRIANEQTRIANEEARIAAETIRQQNEEQRIEHETARVDEFAQLKRDSEQATSDANTAANLANEKAQLAADKAALAQAAAALAGDKAQLADDKAALAQAAATLANEKAALAQQKSEYAQTQGNYANTQGDYAKNQGDYAKEQGNTAKSDHVRAEADHAAAADDHQTAAADHITATADHSTAASDHTRAEADHTTASSDHSRAESDHTTAASDHTRAESDHTTAASDHETAASDHTRAESDHVAVEVYVDSLGVFDLSKHNAVDGVLATYADLSAALTALNALDSKYKYGGMSFKFVQSSDNIYVRYNLMAELFSANVNDWQEEIIPLVGSKSATVITEVSGGQPILFGLNLKANNNYIITVEKTDVVGISVNIENSNGDNIATLTSWQSESIKQYTFKPAEDIYNARISSYVENIGATVKATISQDSVDTETFAVFKNDIEDSIKNINRNPYLFKIEETITTKESGSQNNICYPITLKKGCKYKIEVSKDNDTGISVYLVQNGSIIAEINEFQTANSATYYYTSDNDYSDVYFNSYIGTIGVTATFSIQQDVVRHEDIETIATSTENNTHNIEKHELRIDTLEDEIGIHSTITGYKKVSEITTATQILLDSFENCIVEVFSDIVFQGASNLAINNCIFVVKSGILDFTSYTGELTLQNVYIAGEPKQIFNIGKLNCNGAFITNAAYAEWFGAKGNAVNYDAVCFDKIYKYIKASSINLLPSKNYLFEKTARLKTKLNGAENAKIFFNKIFVEVPVTSVNVIPDSAGNLTFTVNTSSPAYNAESIANLRVGMGISIAPTDQTDEREKVDYKFREIVEINGNTIKVSGGSVSINTGVGNVVNFSLLTEYPLLSMYNNSQLNAVEIEGGYGIIPDGRGYWWFGETVLAGQLVYPYTDNGGYPIGSETLVIRDCYIHDNTADAIMVLGYNALISHNRIEHCAGGAVHLSGLYECEIKDNYIFDTNIKSGETGTGHNHGAIEYSMQIAHLLVDGNYIDTCDYGIFSGATENRKAIYTNNTILHFRNHGIYCSLQLDYDPTYTKIAMDYIICNNKIYNDVELILDSWEEKYQKTPYGVQTRSYGYGIYYTDFAGGHSFENIMICNNIIRECGITVSYADSCVINGNSVFYKDELSDVASPRSIITLGTGNYNIVANFFTILTGLIWNGIIQVNENTKGIVANSIIKRKYQTPLLYGTATGITENNNVVV